MGYKDNLVRKRDGSYVLKHKTKKHKKSDKAPTSMKIDPNKKGKNIAADIFENRKGDWRQIKDDDGNYNQEYLRRLRNGIPVKTA